MKELKSLTTLFLVNAKVTAAGLQELKNLQSLRTLYVSGTEVTADGVSDLQQAMPELQINR